MSLSLKDFFSKSLKKARTFEYFYTFNIFVVDRSSALFNEFIALDTEIDNFCAFHTEVDEFFRDLMDDFGRRLEDDSFSLTDSRLSLDLLCTWSDRPLVEGLSSLYQL